MSRVTKAWHIALSVIRVAFGVAGIGAAAVGLVACFSPVDWPLGALLALIGATVFSIAGDVLHKKLFLVLIPATALAACYPLLFALPWLAAKWAGCRYRSSEKVQPARASAD